MMLRYPRVMFTLPAYYSFLDGRAGVVSGVQRVPVMDVGIIHLLS